MNYKEFIERFKYIFTLQVYDELIVFRYTPHHSGFDLESCEEVNYNMCKLDFTKLIEAFKFQIAEIHSKHTLKLFRNEVDEVICFIKQHNSYDENIEEIISCLFEEKLKVLEKRIHLINRVGEKLFITTGLLIADEDLNRKGAMCDYKPMYKNYDYGSEGYAGFKQMLDLQRLITELVANNQISIKDYMDFMKIINNITISDTPREEKFTLGLI